MAIAAEMDAIRALRTTPAVGLCVSPSFSRAVNTCSQEIQVAMNTCSQAIQEAKPVLWQEGLLKLPKQKFVPGPGNL